MIPFPYMDWIKLHMKHKSLSQLLIDNNYNCELVSKLTRIPLYTVKNTALKLQSTHGNTLIPSKQLEVKDFVPLVMEIYSKFTFGKYKNRKLSAVIKHDPQYIRRAIQNKLLILGDSAKFNSEF